MGLTGPTADFGQDTVLLCDKTEISALVTKSNEEVLSLVRSNDLGIS